MGTKKNLRAYRKDTLIYIPGKIIEGIMGFVTIYFFTKFFPPEEYGLYSLLISGVGLISSLSVGWLNHSILRYSGTKEYKNYFHKTIFNIWLYVNLMVVSIAIIITVLSKELSVNTYLPIIVIFVYLTSNTWRILQTLLRSNRRSIVYTTLLTVGQVVKFVLTVLLVKLSNLGIISIFISISLVDFLSVLIATKNLNLISNIRKSKLSRGVLKRFIQYGFPLVGVSMISWILSASDRYLLAFFRDTSEVGMYSTAYSLVSQPLALITGSLMLSATPIIVASWNKEGYENTVKLISKITLYFITLMFPAIVGITILKEEIFNFIIDHRYYDANIILPWISLGIFFMSLTQYINKYWELQQATKVIFKLTTFSAFLNLVLNLIFIPKYGFNAAAITTLLTYFILFLMSLILNLKNFKMRLDLNKLVKVSIATLIMSISLYLSQDRIDSLFHLIIIIIVNFLVYFIALVFQGMFKDRMKIFERRNIK
ncbi:oligosaccharide flippase family protein [Virgibacillus halodenitrificans]|nr:oligosaccharide flippase family protein [Virgibacillus halodenitrificans]